MGTTGKTPTDWKDSPEYVSAMLAWESEYRACQERGLKYPLFNSSQEYRNARLKYRKRVNGGYTKGEH